MATPSANNRVLQDSIDYACNHVDCSIITIGGPCYDPSSLISHASVAMNLYYQATGRLDSSCDFNGLGLIVISDPSKANFFSTVFGFNKFNDSVVVLKA